MQILFDELTGEDDVAEYIPNPNLKFKIDLKFSSNDPEALTKYVKSKLEKIRTNIIAWRFENEQISVGVGYFYSPIEFGEPEYPYWWTE